MRYFHVLPLLVKVVGEVLSPLANPGSCQFPAATALVYAFVDYTNAALKLVGPYGRLRLRQSRLRGGHAAQVQVNGPRRRKDGKRRAPSSGSGTPPNRRGLARSTLSRTQVRASPSPPLAPRAGQVMGHRGTSCFPRVRAKGPRTSGSAPDAVLPPVSTDRARPRPGRSSSPVG